MTHDQSNASARTPAKVPDALTDRFGVTIPAALPLLDSLSRSQIWLGSQQM